MTGQIQVAPRVGVTRSLAVPTAIATACLLMWAIMHPANAENVATVLGVALKPVEISIDNFTFTPPEVTITSGTTVKWVNHDDIPHAVAEKSIAFRSPPLDTGEGFSHVFETAGEVQYFCSLHPHMVGRIIVK